jgi:pimeloyl-ACP methyl ester carboxylesterase
VTAPARNRPPRRLVLVHGASSGPWVFEPWTGRFPDFEMRVPDLQAGLAVERASMDDYAEQVIAATGGPGAVVVGWSMGGLVAMLAAQQQRLAALVLVEPSQPRELGRHDPTVVPTVGVYDAETMYGPLPPGTRHRPESRLALEERQRGITIPLIDCPLLVIASSSYPTSRGSDVVDHYGGELLEFPTLDHGSVIKAPEVASAITTWLRRQKHAEH